MDCKKKKFKISFYSHNKIGVSSHKLIEHLFGIEGAFLSNESTLEDFVDYADYLPNHKLISLSSIPSSERKLYGKPPKHIDVSKYLVWHPPLTSKDQSLLNSRIRKDLKKRIKRLYNVSIEDYPDEPFYIWKVVDFISDRLEN